MSDAPRILPGSNDHEKLQALSKLTYKQQAVWFLNSFWETMEPDAEKLWKYVHTCADLDLQDHEDGCGLDEVNAHRFLEVYGETLTVRELRSKLRSTKALEENERPKVVPLTHYLLFRYNDDWHTLVNASQGDNSAEIKKAQQMLDEVQAAFKEADARHKEAAASLREAERSAAEAASREADAKATAADAKAKEEDAKAKEAEAVKQEAPFKAAQEELNAALAEVKKQEDEYNNKIADCEARSEQGGVVQRNKAKNELAQLKAEDPLPLQRAKITLEAAEKRAAKARAPFEAATKTAQVARQAAEEASNAAQQAAQAASNARQAADAAKAESERTKQVAEDALNEAKRQVKEAEDYLEEIKSKPGCAHGALWWIDRELHEAKAYIPESKGGYRKK